MDRTHNSDDVDTLVHQVTVACNSAEREQITRIVLRLAATVRELVCERDQLIQERERLLDERSRMASRLTRGPLRPPLADHVPRLS